MSPEAAFWFETWCHWLDKYLPPLPGLEREIQRLDGRVLVGYRVKPENPLR